MVRFYTGTVEKLSAVKNKIYRTQLLDKKKELAIIQLPDKEMYQRATLAQLQPYGQTKFIATKNCSALAL
jgi:hypothetical protein